MPTLALRRLAAALGFLLLLPGAPCTAQQAPAGVRLLGPTGQILTLTAAQLQRLPRVQQRAVGHDQKAHLYSGVALTTLLPKVGTPAGGKLRGAALATYVLVQGADNYQALYALPELDPEFTDRVVLLADRADHQPLAAKDGPFQIIVPGEKKHARWVRQVRSIQVMPAKGR